jgi:hypothetical protein
LSNNVHIDDNKKLNIEKNVIETKNEKLKKNEIKSEISNVHGGNLPSLDVIKSASDTDSRTSQLSRKRSLLDVDVEVEDEVEKTHLNLGLNTNDREHIEGNDHGMIKKRRCDTEKIFESETDLIEGGDVYVNDINTTDDTYNLETQNYTNNNNDDNNNDNNNNNNNNNNNSNNNKYNNNNNSNNKKKNDDDNNNFNGNNNSGDNDNNDDNKNNESKDISNKSDGDSGNYVSERIESECICPICNKDIILLSINDRNVHVNNCCTSGETGVKTPVGAKNSKCIRKPSLHDYFGKSV